MTIFKNCDSPVNSMMNADFELNRLRREKAEKESECMASGAEKCETSGIDTKIEHAENTKKSAKQDMLKCTFSNLLKGSMK